MRKSLEIQWVKFMENLIMKIYIVQNRIFRVSFAFLPIQEWFFAKHLKHPNHWNQSFIVHVPELSVERLSQILPQLIERHDVLRLRFKDGQQIYKWLYDKMYYADYNGSTFGSWFPWLDEMLPAGEMRKL